MGLTAYMIITTIYWSIAFYYPFKGWSITARTFWLPWLIIKILLWVRGKA